MKQQIFVKTYKGTQPSATAAFQRDAPKMAQQGYFPISQTWAQGAYGCGSFLFALLLCIVLIGIIVFIYMLIVKPPGTLTVTYELRARPQFEAFSSGVQPPQLIFSQPPPLPVAVPSPPSGTGYRYRIASNGEELGEFSVATIKTMLSAGKITMQDYYLDRHANDWMPLDCLPDLV